MNNLDLGLGLRLGESGAFNLAALSGLVFWPVAGSLGASPVGSWSYGAGNLTQGTTGSKPTWSASSSNVGNEPSVLYNGSEFLAATNAAPLQITGDITICTLLYLTNLSALRTVISKGSTSEFDVYISTNGTVNLVRASSGGPNPVASPSGIITAATKTILTIVQAGSTVTYYVNGVSKGTSTLNATILSTTNAIQLGQRSDAATVLVGEQPETALVNRAVTFLELTGMHRYFGAKYGIGVP